MAREGGCLCGRIRYRIDAAPIAAMICHCATCRRAAGAQAVAWATFPAAALSWKSGQPARFASSPGVTRTHCHDCGTSLTWQAAAEASIDVTLASLDDPEATPPEREVWLSHRLAWTPTDPDLPGFAEGSEV